MATSYAGNVFINCPFDQELITDWVNIDGLGARNKGAGLRFCETIAGYINRYPNRRGEIERHEDNIRCRVVDYSKPIRITGYHSKREHGLIIGWKLMEQGNG